MEKKIRFGDLVRNSGRPQTYALWTTDPAKDRPLRQAVRENRVLTVVLPDKGAPYGIIGFQQQPQAVYLLFPRSLPTGREVRVIGINYQLLEEPDVADSVQLNRIKTQRSSARPKPVQRHFRVKVRRIATLETTVNIEAPAQKEAEEEAIKSLQHQPFDLRKASIETEITHVE